MTDSTTDVNNIIALIELFPVVRFDRDTNKLVSCAAHHGSSESVAVTWNVLGRIDPVEVMHIGVVRKIERGTQFQFLNFIEFVGVQIESFRKIARALIPLITKVKK